MLAREQYFFKRNVTSLQIYKSRLPLRNFKENFVFFETTILKMFFLSIF